MFGLCYLLAVCSWANHLTILCLSSSANGVASGPSPVGCREQSEVTRSPGVGGDRQHLLLSTLIMNGIFS